ncbi:ORF48 [Ovine gammaherpesvirus 2]|uniref:ORF48 n=1 Tax=Ovine gammaherpesvirus 2 TaxID=10398 RepID=Q2VSJ4_9GAMA|nr:ORF48 [Ovine gammaherpesvirus 2]AAX58082.1 ORF48 [Ovine gammaherpesvirus 2]
MEQVVPVKGLTVQHQAKWNWLIGSFSSHNSAQACLQFIKQISSENEISHCACLLVLVHNMQTQQYLEEEGRAVNLAVVVRCLAEYGFDKVFNRECKEDPESMFYECKDRLALLIESECGCGECLGTSEMLSKTKVTSRMPRLQPHTVLAYEPELCSVYNSAVLCNTVLIPDRLLGDIINQTDFREFGSHTVQAEATTLAICMVMSWIFCLLRQTTLGLLQAVMRHMLQFAVTYELPIHSVRDLHRMDRRLLRLVRQRDVEAGADLEKLNDLLRVPLYQRIMVCKNQLNGQQCLLDPRYEEFKSLIQQATGDTCEQNVGQGTSPTGAAGVQSQWEPLQITDTHPQTKGPSPYSGNASTTHLGGQVSEKHLKDLETLLSEEGTPSQQTLKSEAGSPLIQELFDPGSPEEADSKYMTLDEFEQKLYDQSVEPVIYKEEYFPLGGEGTGP